MYNSYPELSEGRLSAMSTGDCHKITELDILITRLPNGFIYQGYTSKNMIYIPDVKELLNVLTNISLELKRVG